MNRQSRLVVVLALWCLVSPVGRGYGQDGPAPPPPPVRLPEVGLRAEQTARRLQEIERQIRPGPEVENLSATIAAFHARAVALQDSTTRALRSPGLPRVFTREAGRWEAMRRETEAWSAILTQRGEALEQARATLNATRDVWTVARTAAGTLDTPPAITDRINAMLGRLQVVYDGVLKAEGALLALEDGVAAEQATCDEALARIAEARAQFMARLLTRDQPPIWQGPGGVAGLREGWGHVAAGGMADVAPMDAGRSSRGARRVGLLCAVVALALLLRRIRDDPRSRTAGSAEPTTALAVVARPWTCAVFTVTFAVFLWDPVDVPVPPPLLLLLLVVSAARLLPAVLPLSLAKPAAALLGLAALYRILGDAADSAPFFGQVSLVCVAVAAVAVSGWAYRAAGRRCIADDTASGAVLDRAPMVAAALGVVASGVVFAGALGYVSLGRVLAALAFGVVVLSVLIGLWLGIAQAGVTYVLRVWPLSTLNSIERHRALVERSTRRLLAAAAAVTGIVTILHVLGVAGSAWSVLLAILDARAGRGIFSISLGDVLSVVVTMWVALRLSAGLTVLLSEDVFPRVDMGRGASTALPSLLHYVILTVAFIACLGLLGVDVNRITILAGAFGVGIGFGLQDVVNNFAAGLILLIERPIQVGDLVEIGSLTAKVQKIGIRSSVVRTGNGAEVIVPNSKLVASELTNWTLSDRTRQIEVPVVAAYGSNPERVLCVLRDVVARHPGVLSQPAPTALLTGFGERGLTFSVQAWVGALETAGSVRSELALAIHDALARAGIQVPGVAGDVTLREVAVERGVDTGAGSERNE